MTDQQTIDACARKLDATIYYDVEPGVGGLEGPRAYTQRRIIHAVPFDQAPDSFWSTMHELGHVSHQHQGMNPLAAILGLPDPGISDREAEAWLWAIENAGRPLDLIGRTDIQGALTSYLRRTESDGPSLRKLMAIVGREVDIEVLDRLLGEQIRLAGITVAEIAHEWTRQYDRIVGAEKLAA